MPIGTVIAEFFSGIADAWRARRALKAQADLQAGADILNKAIREDTEMREVAARAGAAKRLDADLSNTPIVPAAPPSTAPPAAAPPTIAPAPPPVAAQPQPTPAPLPVAAGPVLALVPAAPAPTATPAAPSASPAPAGAPAPVSGVVAPVSN